MNIELINKYWKEFCHWKDGGSILVKYANHKDALKEYEDWHEDEEVFSSNLDYLIVINDEYAEFRKALAEGKIIEANVNWQKSSDYWEEIRADKEGVLTAWKPHCLRIKPEEPKFKVGDWFTYESELHQINVVFDDSYRAEDGYDYKEDIQPWKPQPGEWVLAWKWNKEPITLVQYYDKLNEVSLYMSKCGHVYNEIMPYLGILPTHLKDNK